MNTRDLHKLLDRSRARTLELLDKVLADAEAAKILAWRPGPGRAHLAWQFMHIAATDDRHLNVRMTGAGPREPEFVRRFAGGSTPDDDIPPGTTIRTYLAERRQALLQHLQGLSDDKLQTKPNPQAQWVYEEWFQVLAWHEAHHHGQAHLTYNLYRAANPQE